MSNTSDKSPSERLSELKLQAKALAERIVLLTQSLGSKLHGDTPSIQDKATSARQMSDAARWFLSLDFPEHLGNAPQMHAVVDALFVQLRTLEVGVDALERQLNSLA